MQGPKVQSLVGDLDPISHKYEKNKSLHATSRHNQEKKNLIL